MQKIMGSQCRPDQVSTEEFNLLISVLSFYCMFCFGYEHQGSRTAGVLAVGTLAHPGHAITNAQDAHKFVESVTIYTNGDSSLAEELAVKVPEGIHVENRRIKRLVKGTDDRGICIEFDEGEQILLAFVVHKPDLSVDRTLSDQLGVECIPGMGIKVTPPFNRTSVEGVYAAGDCCSPLRMIPNAMSMGSFAGCGIARELPRISRKVGGRKGLAS